LHEIHLKQLILLLTEIIAMLPVINLGL